MSWSRSSFGPAGLSACARKPIAGMGEKSFCQLAVKVELASHTSGTQVIHDTNPLPVASITQDAALSSLHLAGAITKHGLSARSARQIEIQPGQKVAPLPRPGARTIGAGTEAGVVYRLANGQLVYVQNAPSRR